MAADPAAAPFVDTNVLLYLLSADAEKAARAEELLAAGVVVSVQVLNEFAHVARRKFRLDWPRLTQSLLDVRDFAEVRPLTLEVHELGLQIAERYGFGIYDALIAAAALHAGCSQLLTEDLQHGQRLNGRLTIRNPFL